MDSDERAAVRDERLNFVLAYTDVQQAIETGDVADVVTACDRLITASRELGLAVFKNSLPKPSVVS